MSHPQVSTVLIQSTPFVFLPLSHSTSTEDLVFKCNLRYAMQCLTQTQLGYMISFVYCGLKSSSLDFPVGKNC